MKERYDSPEIKVVRMGLEGMICQSNVDPSSITLPYTNPFGDTEEAL